MIKLKQVKKQNQYLRIAYISYEFPPDTGKGGIGTYTKQIATAMAIIGFDIHVFAGSQQREISESVDGYHLHWIKCDNSYDYRNKVVSSFKLQHDILSFNLIESPEIGGNAWDIKIHYPAVPLIVRLHAPDYLVESLKKMYVPVSAKLRFVLGALRRLKWDPGYWRKYLKETDEDYQFVQLANYITAPSEAMKRWAVENWKIPSVEITVIPNIFLPFNGFLQIPLVKQQPQKQIVFFGRLNVLKGLVNATRAMRKILIEYPEWQFKIIGDDSNGPYGGITMRSWMKQQLKQVINRIEFVDGLQYELLPDAITEAPIVLLPSLFESFSYTCAEAMAAGKAIVGGKNGGMAMLLQNGVNGLLVNPDSINEIYSAVKILITDDETRYSLALKARKSILTDFDAKKISAQFEAYYKNITN